MTLVCFRHQLLSSQALCELVLSGKAFCVYVHVYAWTCACVCLRVCVCVYTAVSPMFKEA